MSDFIQIIIRLCYSFFLLIRMIFSLYIYLIYLFFKLLAGKRIIFSSLVKKQSVCLYIKAFFY